MTDNPNLGYYKASRGSLSGFDKANLPTGNPNIVADGWSIEQLRAFLLNQSDVNFPSNEWILRIEQMIVDHENDFNNPHHTTLSQIAGDLTAAVLGGIIPGTVPNTAPFYSFDAAASLPLGSIFPATFTPTNLYRRTNGGWFSDVAGDTDPIGTDYVTGRPGVPLFPDMVNNVPSGWATLSGTNYNTTLVASTDTTLSYPQTFQDVNETAVTAPFGIDIPMNQSLQVAYTTTFLIKPTDVGGKLRIYTPDNPTNYMEVSLADGSAVYYADALIGDVIQYSDGVLRISVGFISSSSVAANKLRLIHLNDGQTGDGTRVGSLYRHLFSIGSPQCTGSLLNHPMVKNSANPATVSNLVLDLSVPGTPATLGSFMVTFSMYVQPMLDLAPVTQPTVLSFGDLVITRTQSTFVVTVASTVVFTSDILPGLNVLTLSYSPTKLIFKDLANDRQTVIGSYAPINTTNVYFGKFGGYLHHVAFYPQADNALTVEYLTNG